MAAGLGALGHHGDGAGALDELGHGNGGHHGDDLDAGGVPGLHVLGRVAGAGDDDRHVLVDDDLGHLVGKRAHEHHVDAEGLVGLLAQLVDLVTQPVGVGVHGRDDAQAARLGDRRRQGGVGDPGHAALEDGLLDAEKVADGGAQHD